MMTNTICSAVSHERKTDANDLWDPFIHLIGAFNVMYRTRK